MSAARNVAEVLGRKLSDGRYRGLPGYAEFDPSRLLAYLLAALDLLRKCRPESRDAWDWLAWTPWVDLFGLRLSRHRADVRKRLGDDVRSRVFCDCVFAAIDAGDVGAETLARLYAEQSR